jgi:hypothetical protein
MTMLVAMRASSANQNSIARIDFLFARAISFRRTGKFAAHGSLPLMTWNAGA